MAVVGFINDATFTVVATLPVVPDPPMVQAIACGVASLIPMAGRPRLRNSGEYVPPLELVGVDGVTGDPIDMPESWDRSFTTELNGTGTGTFKVDFSDRDVLADGDLVRFLVDGDVVFTMIVEGGPFDEVTDAEESGRVQTIQGRGIAGLLDAIQIHPEYGPGRKPIVMDRPFDWTALQFQDEAWRNDNGLNYSYSDYANDWRDPVSYESAFNPPGNVRWGGSGTQWWAPLGHCYFRWHLSTDAMRTSYPGWVGSGGRLFLWSDDTAEWFLDGDQITTTTGGRDPQVVTVDLTPGAHVLAVHGENTPPTNIYPDLTWVALDPWTDTVAAGETLFDIAARNYGSERFWPQVFAANAATIQSDAEARGEWDPAQPWAHIYAGQILRVPGTKRGAGAGDPRGNPGGVSWMLGASAESMPAYMADADAASVRSYGAVLADSSQQCRWIEYPAFTPGMTPSRAVGLCVLEHASRWGNKSFVVGTSSTQTVDSGGVPWTQPGAISTKTGTSLLTFLGELTETYIDWELDHSRMLHLWNKGGKGRRTGVVVSTAKVNLAGITGDRDASRRVDALLTSSGVGWTITRTGEHMAEATLGLGALRDAGEVTRIASAQISTLSTQREELRVAIEPVGGDRPCLDFDTGDWITVHRSSGPELVRVMSIAFTEDTDGMVTWVVTCKDRISDTAERFATALSKMSNGTIGGDSRVAQPLWPAIPPAAMRTSHTGG